MQTATMTGSRYRRCRRRYCRRRCRRRRRRRCSRRRHRRQGLAVFVCLCVFVSVCLLSECLLSVAYCLCVCCLLRRLTGKRVFLRMTCERCVAPAETSGRHTRMRGRPQRRTPLEAEPHSPSQHCAFDTTPSRRSWVNTRMVRAKPEARYGKPACTC
jgi:hypothetical protein